MGVIGIIGIITRAFNGILRRVYAKYFVPEDGIIIGPECIRRPESVSGLRFLRRCFPQGGAFQSKGSALGKGDRDFMAGFPDDAIEGLAGDAHACGGIDSVEVLCVSEPQGLDLLGEQHGFLQIAQGDACGLEIIAVRLVGDGSGAGWSGHGTMRM